jgi:radical SAM superfamily enzyme YgiQ (UPF0313 family)
MRVSFITPPPLDGKLPVDRLYGCNYGLYFLPHVPTLYLATESQERGHKVDIVDFASQKKDAKAFESHMKKELSDIYVFYTVFLTSETDKLARDMIRKTNPNAKFIFVGPQPTWDPKMFLDNKDSIVVRGEMDISLQKAMSAIDSEKRLSKVKGVSGFGFENGMSEIVKDINKLPIPDRNLLDHSPYFNPKMKKTPHTAMLTSRGCSYRCTYCVPNSLSFARELEFKKKSKKKKPVVTVRTADSVVKEFRELVDQGFRSVSIIDDQFLWGERRTLDICNGIKNLDVEWSCLARPDRINKRVAEAMASAGCSYIDIGVESFDQKILDSVNKDLKVSEVFKAIDVIKNAGIEPELNILLGSSPLETEKTIKKTLDTVKSLDVRYVLFSITSPFPGTEFYYMCKKNSWMITPDYVPIDPAKDSLISYPHLSKDRLEYWASRAYREFYFRPSYILKQLADIESFSDLKNKIGAAVGVLKTRVL